MSIRATVSPFNRSSPHRVVLGGLERLLVVAVLFAFTGGHYQLVFGYWPEDVAREMRTLTDVHAMRSAWLPIYVGIVAVAGWQLRSIMRCAAAVPWLILLTALAPLSALWSVAPEDTLRRSFALGMTTLFALYLASRFDQEVWLRFLAWALTVATGLSVVAVLLVPEHAVMWIEHPGAWRGLFLHKNTLGHVAALNLLVLSVLLTQGAGHRVVLSAAFVMAGVTLLMSDSLTSMVALATAWLVAVSTMALRNAPAVAARRLLLLVGLGLFAIALLAVAWDHLLQVAGRDVTFTGRSLLWQSSLESAWHRAWLGHGYGAVWLDGQIGPMATMQAAAGWPTLSAHNGYVEVLLDLGLVGATLLAAAIVAALVPLGRRLHASDNVSTHVPAAVLTFVLTYATMESVLLRRNEFIWMLFLTTVATLHRRSGT